MNLEQIVKETVAKIVAEKQGKDLTGDGKIDSADYLKARSNAIEKAKGLDEASIPSNVESLANKIISWYEKHPNPKMQADRLPAVEKNIEYLMSKTVGNNAWDFKTFEKAVKAKYPLVFQESQEINEDYEVAMAQDSLDSIIRAAMMLKAEMGDREVNLPAWIQDHITNSENYINQAAKGYHESDAQMDNNAGAEEMNEANLGHNESSSIEQEGRFWVVTYNTADGTIKKINMNSLDETRDPNSKSDTPYYAVFDVYSKQPHYIIAKSASEMLSRLNGYIKAKAETNPEYKFSYDMEDLQDDYYNGKLMSHVISDDFASVTKNAEEFKQDLSYHPNAIEYKDSQESQELDEATVRRWQHYAGIK